MATQGCSLSLVMVSKSIVETVRENKEPARWRGLKCFIRRWVGRINGNSWVKTRSNVGRWTVNGSNSYCWNFGNVVGCFFSWYAKVGFLFFFLMMMMMMFGLLGSLLVQFVNKRRVENVDCLRHNLAVDNAFVTCCFVLSMLLESDGWLDPNVQAFSGGVREKFVKRFGSIYGKTWNGTAGISKSS